MNTFVTGAPAGLSDLVAALAAPSVTMVCACVGMKYSGERETI